MTETHVITPETNNVPDFKNHPLVGLIVTIYGNAEKHTDKEGRAKVIAVKASAALNKTLDVYTCEIHFIGDRRGYNVQRNIVMRRATV